MIHSHPSLKTQSYSLLSVSRWTVILSIALATADNFAEPDLWIHMLTGQTILRTGHIPRFDTYSYSAAGMPWHNHEWLSQVTLAFCYTHLGVFGLKLLKLICSSVLIVALAIGISASGASGRVQRITLILSAVGIASQMQFRPQLFTFTMLAVVMAVLAIEVYRGGATLWPLIPMFALWANFHGGYIVGLGALLIATGVLFLQGLAHADRMKSARRLGLVMLGCAAATILNPFGVGLWTAVAHSVGDPVIRQVINDWVPLPKMMLSMWRTSKSDLLVDIVPLLMFAAFFAALAMAPDLGDAALSAVATVFIGAAFYATRNVAVGVIALAIPLARHASLALDSRAATEAGARPVEGPEPPAAMLAFCSLALVLVGGTFSNRLKTWKPVPVGAVAFMQQHGLHGNLLAQFEWGSYMLWHMRDSFKVYIDPRGELVYTDKEERDYAIFFYGMEGADSLLDAYPHDYVLIGTYSKGCEVVMKDPRWHLIYRDATASLFARAPVPGVEPIASTAPIAAGTPAATYFP
jgi:hypothetical protein